MFCDECGRNVLCSSEPRTRKISIHGVVIPVRYKANICGNCGAELYDEDVEDYVMRIAREQFRSKKNMLPADRLRAYMKKNGLSADQMAAKAECAVGEVLLDPNADIKLKKVVNG